MKLSGEHSNSLKYCFSYFFSHCCFLLLVLLLLFFAVIYIYTWNGITATPGQKGALSIQSGSPTTREHEHGHKDENPKKKVRRILQHHHGVERDCWALRDPQGGMEQEKPQPE